MYIPYLHVVLDFSLYGSVLAQFQSVILVAMLVSI